MLKARGWLWAGLAFALVAWCVTAFAQELEPNEKPTPVLVFGKIDPDLAHKVAGQILGTCAEPGHAPIVLVIDSHGGYVDAGITIVDAIELCKNHPVWTLDIGTADSMAALIFTYGQRRVMWPGATLMFHNIYMEVGGSPDLILARAEYTKRQSHKYEQHAAEQANLTLPQYRNAIENEWWLSASDALKAGFATEVGTIDI